MTEGWRPPWLSSKADSVASSRHLRAYTPFAPIEMGRDTLLEPETLDGGSSGSIAEPGLKKRVVEQAIESHRERGCVAGRDEQTGLAVCNDLRESTDARGDDRTAACHRFQHPQSAGLLPEARMHEDMRRSQQIRDVVTESEEFCSCCDAEAVAQLSKTRFVGTIPDNHQPCVGCRHLSERAQQVLDALLTNQIGDGHYPNIRRPATQLRVRTETVQVHSVVDRARLGGRIPEAPNAAIAHIIGYAGKTGDPYERGPVEECMTQSWSAVPVIPLVHRAGKVVHEENASRPCRIGHQGDGVARRKQVQVENVEAAGQADEGLQRMLAELFHGGPPDAEAAEPTRNVRMQRFSPKDLQRVPSPLTLGRETEQPHLQRAQFASREVYEQTDAESAHISERGNFHAQELPRRAEMWNC
jgi:hypothetical protein